MRKKILTREDMLRRGEKKLENYGVTDAKNDAWYLLSHVLGITREQYLLAPQEEVEEEGRRTYFDCVGRRAGREPLQHITGNQEFMGISFIVNEHVLIPRQDTECLVEEALREVKDGFAILDMCTGSGCILLSLLVILKKRGFTRVWGTGADISKEALAVAERNREILGIEADLDFSDLFENVEGKYDLIVSNPPYIPRKDMESLQEEVRLYEPPGALDGGEDGLDFYKKIACEAPFFLREGGCLLFEIGWDQGRQVSEIMKNNGFEDVRIKQDLARRDRVVTGRFSTGRKE